MDLVVGVTWLGETTLGVDAVGWSAVVWADSGRLGLGTTDFRMAGVASLSIDIVTTVCPRVSPFETLVTLAAAKETCMLNSKISQKCMTNLPVSQHMLPCERDR